jgi:hypothetical protein
VAPDPLDAHIDPHTTANRYLNAAFLPLAPRADIDPAAAELQAGKPCLGQLFRQGRV